MPWCTPWIEIIFFHCLPIVSRGVMISLWSLVIAISVVWNYILPLSADCLQRYDDFTLVIAIFVDRKLYSTISKVNTMVHICLPIVSRDMMISLWSLVIAIFKVNTMVHICLPIVSRDVMMNYYIPWKSLTGAYHDVRRGLKLYTTIFKVNTIGTHLSTDCLQRYDDELLHSLKKSLTVACHDVRRGLKIIHHDIQSEYNGKQMCTDCLQRCDDELLHSLKKSDRCIPWCTPWIENYTHHDIQSEYNGNTTVHICLPLSPEIWWIHFGHCDIRG